MNKTILFLTQAILSALLGRDIPMDDPALNETAVVLRRRILGMPPILKFPMIILTWAFDIYGVCLTSRMFRNLNGAHRARQVLQWQNSCLGICREFIGFYQKMGAFIYFSLCPLKP